MVVDDLKAKVKASRAEYFREWRKKNRDKVKQYNENYWENRALKEQEQEKE